MEAGGDVKQVFGKIPAGWERGAEWSSDMSGDKPGPKEAMAWHDGIEPWVMDAPTTLCLWMSTSNTSLPRVMLL